METVSKVQEQAADILEELVILKSMTNLIPEERAQKALAEKHQLPPESKKIPAVQLHGRYFYVQILQFTQGRSAGHTLPAAPARGRGS